jgi:hypothetical protein
MQLEEAAALCGVHLVDYGEHRGGALLIASGAGVMMAIMDAEPGFRWCCDVDVGGRAVDFAVLASRRVGLIGLAGWFSLHDPAAFREILTLPLACHVIAYGGNVDLGCAKLEDFLAACAARMPDLRHCTPAEREPLKWSPVDELDGALPKPLPSLPGVAAL